MATSNGYIPYERGDKGEFVNLQHEHQCRKALWPKATLLQTVRDLLAEEKQASRLNGAEAFYARYYRDKEYGARMAEMDLDVVTYPVTTPLAKHYRRKGKPLNLRVACKAALWDVKP